MEIAHLSDAEFKTLVIRILRELLELGKGRREEMKATLSEIKKTPLGTTAKGRKSGIKSTIWNIKKKKHLNRTARRKKNPKKMRIV